LRGLGRHLVLLEHAGGEFGQLLVPLRSHGLRSRRSTSGGRGRRVRRLWATGIGDEEARSLGQRAREREGRDGIGIGIGIGTGVGVAELVVAVRLCRGRT
jgi:hypothetical protein